MSLTIASQILWISLLKSAIAYEVYSKLQQHELPRWISQNPAFLSPNFIDFSDLGFGVITSNESLNQGWVIDVNTEPGLGIDIYLEELHLGLENEDYLIIGGWPVSEIEFKQLKLFTGTFTETHIFRMLNSKKFFILFNAGNSKVPPALTIAFKRYGNAYVNAPDSPEKPVIRETVFEVYLKGRNPGNFSADFLTAMKRAIRATAKEFCENNKISFDENIPTDDMVIFHKISFCPFDWPQQDNCSTIVHSVFVSGRKSADEQIILDYELTSAHLEDMWNQVELKEIQDLGLAVFKFPEPSGVIMLWVIGLGVAVLSSLFLIFVLWNFEKRITSLKESKSDSDFIQIDEYKKQLKCKSSRRQNIPAFMTQANAANAKSKPSESALKAPTVLNTEDRESSPRQPLKNYFGSILFFSNRAFEEDEEEEDVQETSH